MRQTGRPRPLAHSLWGSCRRSGLVCAPHRAVTGHAGHLGWGTRAPGVSAKTTVVYYFNCYFLKFVPVPEHPGPKAGVVPDLMSLQSDEHQSSSTRNQPFLLFSVPARGTSAQQARRWSIARTPLCHSHPLSHGLLLQTPNWLSRFAPAPWGAPQQGARVGRGEGGSAL